MLTSTFFVFFFFLPRGCLGPRRAEDFISGPRIGERMMLTNRRELVSMGWDAVLGAESPEDPEEVLKTQLGQPPRDCFVGPPSLDTWVWLKIKQEGQTAD